MGNILTKTTAIAGDIPFSYGTQLSPPIAQCVVVERLNDDATSNIEGRHRKKSGTAVGHDSLVYQDNYIFGTSGRTGKAWDAIAGGWTNNSKSPYRDKYMLQMLDGSLGTTFDLVAHDSTSSIEAAEIVVHRGYPPVGATAANTNCYLYLSYGAVFQYRVAMEDNRAIRLDFSQDSGATWVCVMSTNHIITSSTLKAAGGKIHFKIRPDSNGELYIDVGDEGDVLHHWYGDATPGKVRLAGKNGWVGIEYYPIHHETLTATKSKDQISAEPHQGIDTARVVVNGLTDSPSGQNVAYQINTDDGASVGWQVAISNPDPTQQTKMSDATLLIDEVWSDHVDGDFSIPVYEDLPIIRTEETETWDDVQRCILTSGNITIDNSDQRFNRAFGNFSLELSAALGDTDVGFDRDYLRCTGVVGAGEQGIEIYKSDPIRIVNAPYTDKRVMMMVPLANEVIYDRWCLFGAVRHAARCGNVHPRFLATIPYWPDGPADDSCPYPILGSGSGNNPRYKFGPEWICFQILLYLAADQGLPISDGVSLPYFTGFDLGGQLRFEAYDPLATPAQIMYTTNRSLVDYSSTLPITDSISIFNSTAGMRSEVNFQGLDALTFQLQQVHIQNSVAVRKSLGFRYPMFERNSRYGTGDSIVSIAQTASAVSSLGSQIVRFKSVFAPWIHAGATMLVADEDLGIGEYVIINLRNVWGSDPAGQSGKRDCYSIVTGRNVSAYPSASGFLF